MEVRNDCAVEDRNDEPPKEASDTVEEACEDATELRRLSIACWNIRWIISGRCLASKASMCRIESSGISRSSMLAVAAVLKVTGGRRLEWRDCSFLVRGAWASDEKDRWGERDGDGDGD